MRMFLISDNTDTQYGLRMAGIEGIVVHEKKEVLAALEDAVKNPDIGIIILTNKLAQLCRDKVYEYKTSLHRPLLVVISDRHGDLNISELISGYIREAIGIKL